MLSATMLGVFLGPPSDRLWKSELRQNRLFAASSFTYTLLGLVVLLNRAALDRHAAWFPWTVFGLSGVAQGFLSYMGDVAAIGTDWGRADRMLAITHTGAITLLVGTCLAGTTFFPRRAVVCLGVGLVLSLGCKAKGASALRARSLAQYVRWHGLWHLFLPLGGCLFVLSV